MADSLPSFYDIVMIAWSIVVAILYMFAIFVVFAVIMLLIILAIVIIVYIVWGILILLGCVIGYIHSICVNRTNVSGSQDATHNTSQDATHNTSQDATHNTSQNSGQVNHPTVVEIDSSPVPLAIPVPVTASMGAVPLPVSLPVSVQPMSIEQSHNVPTKSSTHRYNRIM
jgi:hypothetical protein